MSGEETCRCYNGDFHCQFGEQFYSMLEFLIFLLQAAHKNEIMDLNNTFKDKLFPRKNLIARTCKVWTIQEAIQSLGGLPVLFPLLEQACFKTKKADVSNPDELLNLVNNSEEENMNNGDLSGTGGHFGISSDKDKNDEEGIDCVDGRPPVLSDLPVAYSPRKFYFPQYDEKDPSTWTQEVDEELTRIEVVDQSHGDQGLEALDQDKNKTARELVDTGAIGLHAAATGTAKEGWMQLATSKSSDELVKKHGSFIVLGTPPLQRLEKTPDLFVTSFNYFGNIFIHGEKNIVTSPNYIHTSPTRLWTETNILTTCEII